MGKTNYSTHLICISSSHNKQMSVTERVKLFLEEKKMNQAAFCRATGYSINNFSNFLSGKTTNPRIDLIHAFTTHFPELSINWLFTGDGSMWTNGEGGSPLKVVKEEPEEVDPEKEMLKEELLTVYKDQAKILEVQTRMLEDKVKTLEREIQEHCEGLAERMGL